MTRLWILLEWIEEDKTFPTYGVIDVDPTLYPDYVLYEGRQILVRDRNQCTGRKAKVLATSGNKRHIYDQKRLLYRQDNKMKDMLSNCMQSLKDINQESAYLRGLRLIESGLTSINTSADANPVTDTNSSFSSSDNESSRGLSLKRSSLPTNSFHQRSDSFGSDSKSRRSLSARYDRSMLSSTPISIPNRAVTKVDNETQTDPLEDLSVLEERLRDLYGLFVSVLVRLEIQKSAETTNMNEEVLKKLLERIPSQAIARNVRKMSLDDILHELSTATTDKEILALRLQKDLQHLAPPKDSSHNNDQPDSNTRVSTEGEATENLNVSTQSTSETNESIRTSPVDEMIGLGEGFAQIPKRVLNKINWNSYTIATRQLLQALFSRKVLATHSLSGKQSPAFTDKPAKQRLDPKLVNDIVNTVAKKCNVQKQIVRNIITVKCTDEAKLYKNRQHRKRRNEENIPPGLGNISEGS